MADPRFKDIADAIIARIAAITIAGGYNFDMGPTGIGRVLASEIPGTKPAAYVWGMAFERRTWAQLGDPSDVIESVARIRVRIFARGTNPYADIPLVVKDVVAAVEADPYPVGLSAYVDAVLATDLEEVQSSPEIQKPDALSDVIFEARYRMARGQV